MVRLKVGFAAICGVSVSGNRYWLLIPIAYPEQYNESKFFIEVLENHGSEIDKETGNKKYFTRPNKTSGVSGEYDCIKNVFYVFTSNGAPLNPIRGLVLFKFLQY